MPAIWRHPRHDQGGINILAEKTDYADPKSYLQFGVLQGDGFVALTKECLTMLCKTSCGDAVLSFLCGTNTDISMFAVENSVQYTGSAHNSVAATVWGTGGNWAAVGLAITKMRMTYGFSPAAGNRALAHVVNSQPDWELASQNPHAFSVDSQFRTVKAGGNTTLTPLSDAMLGNWITTGNAPALNAVQLQAAKKGLVVALERFSTTGAAVGSTAVMFYTNLSYYTDRPPAISLGHELIHAYFALKGVQPGAMTGPSKGAVALNEYKCVGIGLWDGAAISENALRSQWGKVVFWNWLKMTKQNRKCPGKRTHYD